MIIYAESQQLFHLRNRELSYAMQLVDGRFLAHLYWGPPLAALDPATLLETAAAPYLATIPLGEGAGRTGGGATASKPGAEGEHGGGGIRGGEAIAAPEADRGPRFSLDMLPQEYPAWGTGEQREGAYRAILSDGTEAARLEYAEHEILSGAHQPESMEILREDHGFGSVETLRVRLTDPRGDLWVDLFYLLAEDASALVRWARFTNCGDGPITVLDPSSASVDLEPGRYDTVTLGGAWGRERHVVRKSAPFGRYSVASRGGASGHQSNPFIALCDPETNESSGRAFAVALGYSGNFQASCDVDQYDQPRLSIGINRLRQQLEPDEHFDTPPALLVQSKAGFSGMSESFHRFIREGVIARRWAETPRKVIINSWEAMYFQVNAERVVALAKEGKKIGAELLVLDDGWFSGRRDDTTSLGDWWHNAELFPDGLGPVAEAVRAEGLEFGIWMEPEMVSPESRLYGDHPDWALHVPGREPTLGRSQLILDLANPEVQDHLFETVSRVLEESGATYVKWDMNRNMSEAGSPTLPAERQGEVMHRYILGLYSLYRRLTSAFPDVIFEGCAGGGGRFDIGLARFAPRFWTSDQSDAVERLDIQYGTTLVFPPELIGSHVSSVPNHQVGRTTPAKTRVLTALPFSFGFELDPSKEQPEECEEYLLGASHFKELRGRFHHGHFRRLLGPLAAGGGRRLAGEGGGETAWMVGTPEWEEFLLFYYRPLTGANYRPGYLRVPGLPAGRYRDCETEQEFDGEQLSFRGVRLPGGEGDYQARVWHFARTAT